MATTKEEIGAASLSPDHLEYRRICAAIDTFEQPGYRGDEAGDAARWDSHPPVSPPSGRLPTGGSRCYRGARVAKPAETLGDVLLRGEIALRKTKAGDDERASDELARAVVKVMGGKPPSDRVASGS